MPVDNVKNMYVYGTDDCRLLGDYHTHAINGFRLICLVDPVIKYTYIYMCLVK